MSSADLIDIFNAHSGVISCVGAGGKKTTMFRLAEAHAGRVGITATAHIEFFPKNLDATCYIGDEDALLEAISVDHDSRVMAFARPSSRFGRRAGVSVDAIPRFKEAGKFDLMVIKADGARSRFIKAPAEHEPVLSRHTDTVIPVLSAKVIGQPLSKELVHRVKLFSELVELEQEGEIKPEHVARLLSSEQGSLKGVGTATVIPVINMVDDAELEKVATLAAEQALSMTDRFDRVVLAAMKKRDPVVKVIQRQD